MWKQVHKIKFYKVILKGNPDTDPTQLHKSWF